jgi:sigma-B regulation protein RsbU (phosphoserine phosphatase)
MISDWMMPVMDGVSLCQKVREQTEIPRPFFFLITGKKKGLSNFSEALEAGVDDVIYKPVDFYVFKNQLQMAYRPRPDKEDNP